MQWGHLVWEQKQLPEQNSGGDGLHLSQKVILLDIGFSSLPFCFLSFSPIMAPSHLTLSVVYTSGILVIDHWLRDLLSRCPVMGCNKPN